MESCLLLKKSVTNGLGLISPLSRLYIFTIHSLSLLPRGQHHTPQDIFVAALFGSLLLLLLFFSHGKNTTVT